jgi:hypothetical protein
MPTIKQEPDIEPGPVTDGRSWTPVPFMTWHNTSTDPIVIDEDDGTTQIGSIFESGSDTMLGKDNAEIPKGGIAGGSFQDRLRNVQQTFFKSLRSQPKAVGTPQALDPPPVINLTDEVGHDEMDIDTLDDEAKASWEG